MFSLKQGGGSHDSEPANSLLRVVQLLIQGLSWYSVEFDRDEYSDLRSSLRFLSERFEEATDHKELLSLAGETNKTIQSYNQLVEKFIHELGQEKQLAVELLAESLLRVCHSSEKTAQTLRQIEKDLAKASQLHDMRELRVKLAECVGTLCQEAEMQEARHRELKEHLAESNAALDSKDRVTGLASLKSAEGRMKELAASSRQNFVLVFVLKNLDVVNRRFGFSAGDAVLRKFASHLKSGFHASEQLFRWRGPCFVVTAERLVTIDLVQAEAQKLGMRGPDAEVEGNGKSMLMRLTAATTAFAIGRNSVISELSEKIDHFAADQFKVSPGAQ